MEILYSLFFLMYKCTKIENYNNRKIGKTVYTIKEKILLVLSDQKKNIYI